MMHDYLILHQRHVEGMVAAQLRSRYPLLRRAARTMSLANLPEQCISDVIDLQGREIIRLREELAQLQVRERRRWKRVILLITVDSQYYHAA